jgi:antitoxin YefM
MKWEADLTETTYSNLRASLATILDRVANDREVVVVRRRGVRTVAMLPADELSGLLETAHLLRSPKNAQRLLKALHRAVKGRVKRQSVDKLRLAMGLGATR